MDPRINIIILYFIKDIKLYDKTSKEKKGIIDEKFRTPETISQRKRILSTFTKTPKKRCFYLTNQWLYLKKEVHKLYQCGCMKCGKIEGETHIDHILPRSLHPELQYSIHNLQILCKDCNMEKSNKHNTDYRTELQKQLCYLNHP
jgi:5-methylcytosine-specific restriction endonuclease McrA